MKTVALISSGVVGIVALATIITWYGVNKDATLAENGLEAKYTANQNEMASYTNKVTELAQVAKLSTDAQTKLMQIANESRYGKQGNSVAMMITEQNIPMDISVVKQFAVVVSAERDRFREAQTELTDKIRNYKDLWASPINAMLLHKQVNLTKYDIIINGYTAKAYETKRAEALEFKL